VHGIFLTDDWGVQDRTLVSPVVFKEFFYDRYRQLFQAVHDNGWHVILHSCGKINEFVPFFIELGVNVLNMMQPQVYGLRDFGKQFAGKVCFLGTVDIQSTLPQGDRDAIESEAEELIKHWSTPQGGFIVFNYGASKAIGATEIMTQVMFKKFYDLRNYWTGLKE
jgi:uroporphyrinogen decarboxylase